MVGINAPFRNEDLCLQTLPGINVLIYYSSYVLLSANFPASEALLVSLNKSHSLKTTFSMVSDNGDSGP